MKFIFLYASSLLAVSICSFSEVGCFPNVIGCLSSVVPSNILGVHPVDSPASNDFISDHHLLFGSRLFITSHRDVLYRVFSTGATVGSVSVVFWILGCTEFRRLENLGAGVGWPSGVGAGVWYFLNGDSPISGIFVGLEKSGTMFAHGAYLFFSHSNIDYL